MVARLIFAYAGAVLVNSFLPPLGFFWFIAWLIDVIRNRK